MVGSAAQPQSQSQLPSAEEEALKTNTDCVYFLASPLTCKKGSECEYRHSDIARVNPRDCYFWLHGNCLNPKCGFRHPPLDGLLGAQKSTPSGPAATTAQPVATPGPHVPNVSTKPGVACIFFQKGYCLKGDWCPFLHVPSSLSNKVSSVPGTASTAEPAATIKKASSALDISMQVKKAAPVNAARSVKDLPQSKHPVLMESTRPPPRNEMPINRRVPETSGITEFPGYKRAPYASNGIQESWSGHVLQPHLLDEPEGINGKDAEELSREPSPGFDVLVDDENRDSEYYPADDRYGMSMEHDASDRYDVDHPTDYNMIAAVDDERYQDSHNYDSHEHCRGQYAWEQHKTERMSGRSYTERKPYDRPDNLSQVDTLDLRHQLSKHRKHNGLRSVISHENSHDLQVGDQNSHGSRRDEQHNSLGRRLQGRIQLPGRDKKLSRASDHARLSPGRANFSSHHGRIQNRVKGRVEEAFNNGGRNYRELHVNRDTAGDNSVDFAGPKSLAELKNRKNAEPIRQHGTDQQSLVKRKHSILEGHQQSENDLSFEGPKPLGEILKRKRGESVGALSGRNSFHSEGIVEDENQGAGATKDEDCNSASLQKIDAEESRPAISNPILRSVASKLEAEDGLHHEDGVDQESGAYDRKGGEFNYEQAGGKDFGTHNGENGDAAGEYLDDEDDDDFAKKMGVMYS